MVRTPSVIAEEVVRARGVVAAARVLADRDVAEVRDIGDVVRIDSVRRSVKDHGPGGVIVLGIVDVGGEPDAVGHLDHEPLYDRIGV